MEATPKRRGRPPKTEPSRAAEVFDDKFGEAVQRAAGVKLDKAKVDAEYKAAMDRVTLLYAEETILGGEAFPAKIADVALPQTETANSLGSGNEQHWPKPLSADGLGEYTLSMTKPRLNEAVEHLEAILMLIQGFNGNHELIKGWCRECDGNYLHGQESCLCPCHPARDFLVAVKKELAQPRL